jgi:hypothetical protein
VANEQNLVPITSKKQARELGSKGGKVRSPKKKWAARLRAMKKKGLTDDNYKRIIAWIEEPESSVLDIFAYLEAVKKECKNASQMNQVAQSLIQLHKAHHGDKTKQQFNLQATDSQIVINIIKPEDVVEEGTDK